MPDQEGHGGAPSRCASGTYVGQPACEKVVFYIDNFVAIFMRDATQEFKEFALLRVF